MRRVKTEVVLCVWVGDASRAKKIEKEQTW